MSHKIIVAVAYFFALIIGLKMLYFQGKMDVSTENPAFRKCVE